MSDKHPAPWRIGTEDMLVDANNEAMFRREVVESHNSLAAERDECLRQNAEMVAELKAAHDAHELTKAENERLREILLNLAYVVQSILDADWVGLAPGPKKKLKAVLACAQESVKETQHETQATVRQ